MEIRCRNQRAPPQIRPSRVVPAQPARRPVRRSLTSSWVAGCLHCLGRSEVDVEVNGGRSLLHITPLGMVLLDTLSPLRPTGCISWHIEVHTPKAFPWYNE
jgi:hypothetical protein